MNRSRSVNPKLASDGAFGGAVDVYRDQEMLVSGPASIANSAMWRFMLDRAGLQVVDAIDVTDPMVLDVAVPRARAVD